MVAPVALIGALVGALVVWAIGSLVVYTLFGEAMIRDRLGHLQEGSGLVWPTGSQVVEFKYEPYMFDPPSWGKVLIPAASREAFQVVVEEKEDIRKNVSVSSGQYPAWWNPKDVITERYFITDEKMLVKIILADEDEAGCMVYIFCVHAY